MTLVLPPHPLVAGLAASVVDKAALERAVATAAGFAADQEQGEGEFTLKSLKAALASTAASKAARETKGMSSEQQTRVRNDLRRERDREHAQWGRIRTLVTDPGTDEVVMFGGYLGAHHYQDAQQPDSKSWHVLFTDEEVATWMIVPTDDIKLYNRIHDATAAFSLRDIIWVRSDARVARGESSISIESLWTNGPYTRAAEFEPTLRPATDNRSSGLLCQVRTPHCCNRRSP